MKLMVIDGNSILNRAFYGVRPLSTRDGIPTNAVFGFLNILLKLVEEEKPEALCCTFDLKAPTFRHLAYEGYKAQRKPMPEELAAQLPIIREVLDAMSIPRYELEGWEADDLIGTIARIDEAAGWETVVVTGDKDSLQLITDHVTVKLVTSRMGQTTTRDMTPAAFREEYGFDPIHIIDLKALMGDSSDNIPGVKGVGEKTAMGLIQLYGSIGHLYDHMPDICQAPGTPAKPGVVKKLSEGEADARMSYDLATIHTDAPIGFQPEEAVRRPAKEGELYELLLRLEFAKLIDRLGLKGPQGEVRGEETVFSGTCNAETVEGNERTEALLALYEKAPWVGVLALPDLNGLAVGCWESGEDFRTALFFPDRVPGYNDFLKTLFSERVKKVSHRVKDLMNSLLGEGLSTGGFLFDTELAAYLLSPTDGSYELDKLGMARFHQEYPKAKDYLAADAFAPLADHTAAEAALHAHCMLVCTLWEEMAAQLKELALDKVYYELELPLCPVLAEMERAGVLVDRRALAQFGEMLDERLKADEAAIYALAGEQFNINSTQQLGHILFDKLGLPPVKKTKTGYSTNAEVLEKLRGQHDIIDLILEYRQYAKLKSTYVDGLDKVIEEDGRIRTSFQNTVTATGRLSSTEPNLQNIPVRTELGAKLRYMFVAAAGNVLVDADYSQIELRLLAHIAGDTAMQAAFLSGEDVHTATAAQVFGVDTKDVTHEMRRRAKAVNFGIVYGISAFSLSEDIHVPVYEAKEYMERYLTTFDGVAGYQTRIVEEAKDRGYVTTLMGRRRWLPELKSSNYNLRAFGERVALNMPIQGTAADVIKLAMIRVRNAMKQAGLKAKLILQVHDELIVECPEEEAEQVKTLLSREMEDAVHYAVPLRADAAVGKSWGEAKG
ncbi:DNA polymerase I [Vermiculatibacterium agrestimuris]|uniref:DNA polymerase I n=1 Tax=Vermiculatibacterium agrestimuris TaxID=2941519 RepID=UPI002040E8E3|nr:DNA polymerase I [Vermiculatibacterium agrestimuris]